MRKIRLTFIEILLWARPSVRLTALIRSCLLWWDIVGRYYSHFTNFRLWRSVEWGTCTRSTSPKCQVWTQTQLVLNPKFIFSPHNSFYIPKDMDKYIYFVCEEEHLIKQLCKYRLLSPIWQMNIVSFI